MPASKRAVLPKMLPAAEELLAVVKVVLARDDEGKPMIRWYSRAELDGLHDTIDRFLKSRAAARAKRHGKKS